MSCSSSAQRSNGRLATWTTYYATCSTCSLEANTLMCLGVASGRCAGVACNARPPGNAAQGKRIFYVSTVSSRVGDAGTYLSPYLTIIMLEPFAAGFHTFSEFVLSRIQSGGEANIDHMLVSSTRRVCLEIASIHPSLSLRPRAQ